ncbi:MAG: TonB-dependent receptor [Nitrospinae bacterium]|nr:TonB-dependent receptor [Nitrospinota bacterium]
MLGRLAAAIILAALPVVFAGPSAHALNGSGNGNGKPADTLYAAVYDDEAVQNLVSILEEKTEIATKTKLNQDHVPGIVTVLRGQDLEAHGVRTVAEALTEAPGMDVLLDNIGSWKLMVRGLSESFSSGAVKIMLNDIPMNMTIAAKANPVLNMPIEQVDRIEIIRGPGSTVHGEYAILGVINVITSDMGQRITGAAGSFSTFSGSGLFSYNDPGRNLQASLNLAGRVTDGADSKAGKDALYEPFYNLGSISNAPGPASENGQFNAAVLKIGAGRLSLTAQALDDGLGEHFGISSSLPEPSSRLADWSKQRMVEAAYEYNHADSLSVKVKAGYGENTEFNDTLLIMPPGGGFYPDGWYYSMFFQESKTSGGVDALWRGINGHEILLGLSVSRIRVLDTWVESNVDLETFTQTDSMVRYQGGSFWINENKTRSAKSVMLQDQAQVGEKLILTIGGRYDDYDDAGNSFNPRLSAVWSIDDTHILKAQYATAYRPATFSELFNALDPATIINPERIETYELGYVYTEEDVVARLTLFYSDIKDLIRNNGYGFENFQGARSYGAEAEFEAKPGQYMKVFGNVSLAHSIDKDTDRELADSTPVISKLGMTLMPAKSVTLSALWRYVGDRARPAGDTRGELPGYNTLDFTGSFFNVGMKGLSLRVGVKNTLDNSIKDPSTIAYLPDGSFVPLYRDDLSIAGRQFWAQASYNF